MLILNFMVHWSAMPRRFSADILGNGYSSHSEVVGLVNLEAADYFLPSITTPQTGLSDWSQGGGILSFPDVLSISRALIEASSWSSEEQFERGVASRSLVHKSYSWDHVTPLWHNLYTQLPS